MRCPNCKQVLADDMNTKINFCPFCGKRLYDESKQYLLHIYGMMQSSAAISNMLVFVDEKQMYELKPQDGLLIAMNAGFHMIKFRCGVRSKSIQILLDSDFEIKTHFNALTGLIETTVSGLDGTEDGHTVKEVSGEELSKPVMVSETGEKGFEAALGDDDPDYEIKAASGLKEGVLKLYSERSEFSANGEIQKDIVDYKNILSVKRKMGAIDIQCAGNVHKVYSIPKDIYNEVIAFLTKRVEEVRQK